jgi:hypothetical protein
VIKLRKGDRYHYIFCEMVASCNYAVAGGTALASDEGQLFTQEALDALIDAQKRAMVGDIEIEVTVALPEPGDATSTWTKASMRAQSARAQSSDETGGG